MLIGEGNLGTSTTCTPNTGFSLNSFPGSETTFSLASTKTGPSNPTDLQASCGASSSWSIIGLAFSPSPTNQKSKVMGGYQGSAPSGAVFLSSGIRWSVTGFSCNSSLPEQQSLSFIMELRAASGPLKVEESTTMFCAKGASTPTVSTDYNDTNSSGKTMTGSLSVSISPNDKVNFSISVPPGSTNKVSTTALDLTTGKSASVSVVVAGASTGLVVASVGITGPISCT